MDLGTRYKDFLRRMGYDGVVNKGPLAAMLAHPKAAVFVEWLTEQVSPLCILEPEDLSGYASLIASGQAFKGLPLEQALSRLEEPTEEVAITDDELRSSVAALTEGVRATKAANARLQQQCTVLNEEANQQRSLYDRLKASMRIAEQAHQQQLQAARQQNTQFNLQLDRLVQCTADVTSALEDASIGALASSESAGLMSRQNMTDFHVAEEKFMEQLTAFTKKQFFKGIAGMSGEKHSCHLLDTTNPEQGLLEGDSSTAIQEACWELSRLRSLFASSELQRVRAKAAAAEAEACCSLLEKQLASAIGSIQDRGHEALSLQVSEKQEKLKQVNEQLHQLSGEVMPAALHELAALQDTHVLSGNYRLKLARQSYFLDKQQELIDHLLQQRARHELITMVMEIEQRHHRDAHHLLTAVEKQLAACTDRFDGMTTALANPSLKPPDPERRTVDSSDTTMASLTKLLTDDAEGQDGRHVVFTYGRLQERATQLTEHVSSLRVQLAAADHAQQQHIASLVQTAHSCEKAVVSGGMKDGLPNLTIKEVHDNMKQLEQSVNMLQQAVKETLRERDDKKKILDTDGVQKGERELFLHFFNDPSRLQFIVQQLSAHSAPSQHHPTLR